MRPVGRWGQQGGDPRHRNEARSSDEVGNLSYRRNDDVWIEAKDEIKRKERQDDEAS